MYPESKIRKVTDIQKLGPMEFKVGRYDPDSTLAPKPSARRCADTLGHGRKLQAIGTYGCHGLGGSQVCLIGC